ncbi:MAG TPA: D-alanyl-D-alanine carboxypeptidase family protein [Candidatus Binataceae bacterium]|nr:D-alanyl-D-alanine carboxypeptidase family protein [Candidatus Binataceae bacterium]
MGERAGSGFLAKTTIMVAIFMAVAAGSAAAARHHTSHAENAPPSIPLTDIHVLGNRPAPFALDARAAYLIDAKTGDVLYSYNEHEKIQPASLAKIMTFYLVLDAMKNGKVSTDTKVTISEQAWRLSVDQTVSHMFLNVGQQVSVNDLLYGLMVSSGNDAAVALAEYVGGSTDAFTNMMNDKAKAIGLTDTHFANPDGLPVEGESTTAADMVKLGRSLLMNHPEATTYTSAKEYVFNNIHQNNFNALLFHDSRVNGIKTGHVAEAGYHLVASASSNGTNLISAVLGTPSEEKRRDETEKLLDWAFRTFVSYQPDLKKVPATMPVTGGVEDVVKIGPAGIPAVTLARGEDQRVSVSWAPAERYVNAPFPKGTQVGEVEVTLDGKPLAAIPIVTQAAVDRGGIFKRLKDRVERAL